MRTSAEKKVYFVFCWGKIKTINVTFFHCNLQELVKKSKLGECVLNPSVQINYLLYFKQRLVASFDLDVLIPMY